MPMAFINEVLALKAELLPLASASSTRVMGRATPVPLALGPEIKASMALPPMKVDGRVFGKWAIAMASKAEFPLAASAGSTSPT
jgi:hypothetical protein